MQEMQGYEDDRLKVKVEVEDVRFADERDHVFLRSPECAACKSKTSASRTNAIMSFRDRMKVSRGIHSRAILKKFTYRLLNKF